VVQAQGGQASEVDGARSGQDVGQDAVVSAAPSVSAAPGAAGEVADLAFHHRPIRSVVLLPARIALARFCVLQRGFIWVDADHPSPTGFCAIGPQRARPTEDTEARDAMTQARHGWPRCDERGR